MKKDGDHNYDTYYSVSGLLKQKNGITLDIEQNFAVLPDARDYKAMLKRGGCTRLSILCVREAKAKEKTAYRVR